MKLLCPDSLGGKFGSSSSANDGVYDPALLTCVSGDLPISYEKKMKRLGYSTYLPTVFLIIHAGGSRAEHHSASPSYLLQPQSSVVSNTLRGSGLDVLKGCPD